MKATRSLYLSMRILLLTLRKINCYLLLLILEKGAKLVKHMLKKLVLIVTAQSILNMNLKRSNHILISGSLSCLVMFMATNLTQSLLHIHQVLLQLLKLNLSSGPRSLILSLRSLESLVAPSHRGLIDKIHSIQVLWRSKQNTISQMKVVPQLFVERIELC